MVIINLLLKFANWFWQWPILALCGGGGLYLGIRTGFFSYVN